MTIETKFNPKDRVLILHDNKVTELEVLVVRAWINTESVSISYRMRLGADYADIPEEKCFATKDDLIKSL